MENVGVDLFSGVYKGKKVLVTGHSGFKGSWLVTWLIQLGAEVYGYSLKPIANENFDACNLTHHMHHCEGDIRDLNHLQAYINQVKPDIAFHLAAQPLVTHSYTDPHLTFETNVMGTVKFFEAVRSCSSVKVTINVTSDKCYQNNEGKSSYVEADVLGGNDPYSASKACSELITHSYIQSFFSPETKTSIASVRAGNVIGGGDKGENRIVPDAFKAYFNSESLSIRNPASVRPWQFVLEPLFGYLKLGEKLLTEGHKFSGAWNFGPSSEHTHTVLDVVKELKKHLPELETSFSDETNQVTETQLLKLDSTKAENLLGWKSSLSFEETIQLTAKGYQDEVNFKGNQLLQQRIEQIETYCKVVCQNQTR